MPRGKKPEKLSDQVRRRSEEPVEHEESDDAIPEYVDPDTLIPTGSTMMDLAMSDRIEGGYQMGRIDLLVGDAGVAGNDRIRPIQCLAVGSVNSIDDIRFHGTSAVGEDRISLGHVERRGCAAPERERAVVGKGRSAETEFLNMPHGVADPGFEQQQAYRNEVHRPHQRLAHARRPVETTAVINGSPDGLELGGVDDDRRVEDDRCGRVAVLEGGRINERLE